MAESQNHDHVKLLWTGGWDSTFQLLQLLLVHRCRVTPVYLIAHSRQSTGVEIQTMVRIKEALVEKHPYVQELLGPTEFYGMSDIRSDRDIEQALDSIRERQHCGQQYGWFARYCKQFSLDQLQLGVHRSDATEILRPYMTTGQQASFHVQQIDDKYHEMDIYTVFRYFTFPIYDLTKVEMAQMAEERGWYQIMASTWFCFHPKRGVRGAIPCGRCSSCGFATRKRHELADSAETKNPSVTARSVFDRSPIRLAAI